MRDFSSVGGACIFSCSAEMSASLAMLVCFLHVCAFETCMKLNLMET